MHKIDRTSYGVYIILKGPMEVADFGSYIADLEAVLKTINGPYSAIIDAREGIPSKPEVLELFHGQLAGTKSTPLQRLAILAKSPVIKNQIIQLAFRSETSETIRFFDTTKVPDWERQSLEWVSRGIEPDYEPAPTDKMKIRQR
ncbi:hypothetical protein TRIP_C20863 [Candidatus Zixiibacteriota bacterium]|nr:hypothetical protein TRIP_C20863 [candidate division Zixibacteria bacterium]